MICGASPSYLTCESLFPPAALGEQRLPPGLWGRFQVTLRVTQRNEGPRGSIDFQLEMRQGKEQAGTALAMHSIEGGWEGLEAPHGAWVSWALRVLKEPNMKTPCRAGPAHQAPRGHWVCQRAELTPPLLPLPPYLGLQPGSIFPSSHPCAPLFRPPRLRLMGKRTPCSKISRQPGDAFLKLAIP